MAASSPSIARRGWCPTTLRPMPSGDGLLVRVRPRHGRGAPAHFRLIADCAARYGNGLIDLTRRGGLQLRGVSERTYPALIDALDEAGLVAPDVAAEAAQAVLVSPLLDIAGEDIARLDAVAVMLAALLAADGLAARLPPKFGFAYDAGDAPVLSGIPADIRIERGEGGGVIVVPDGSSSGIEADGDAVATRVAALARAFIAGRGEARRMRDWAGRDAAAVALGPLRARIRPATAPQPGLVATGSDALAAIQIGFAFGQVRASQLDALAARAEEAGARDIRVTPWRSLILAGAGAAALTPILAECRADGDSIVAPGDPRLSIDSCVGAPACASARLETRALANAIARLPLPAGLSVHVSGCEKGCARDHAADITLVGRADGIALVRGGRAADPPDHAGLTAQEAIALLAGQVQTG